MTPEERAVIEAARELAALYSRRRPPKGEKFHPLATCLVEAVAALPVPLAERLPGLRPGAVVQIGTGVNFLVVANDPEAQQVWARAGDGAGRNNATWGYGLITSIVSEAPDAG